MTKRLSLGGRLRIAAACPDANAPLFAEAAEAIEQHEAYKQKVSDAVEAYLNPDNRIYSHTLNQFIITKPTPDPLVEVLQESDQEFDPEWGFSPKWYYAPQAKAIRAALEARGLEIRSKNDD